MEKFNPNKKRWEPLWGDTSVDLTGFLSDKTVKKCAPAPKEPKKQHSHFRVSGRNRKYGH